MSIQPTSQVKAAFAVLTALYEAIQSTGKAGLPSGHLYAMLMGKVRLDQYEQLINVLIISGKVTRSNHLLVACTPFESVQPAPDMAAFELGRGR